MSTTASYSEKAKGWTSFFSYIPDMICKLNNRYFTLKNGQLWLHNDGDNPIRNNFYGEQHFSEITTVINDEAQTDKIFKTIVLESNAKWDVEIETNLTKSHIKAIEFNTRESKQFSFIRGNENANATGGNAAQGIGVITAIVSNVISFASIPILVSEGDILIQINGVLQQTIGAIATINRTTNKITLESINTPLIGGLYCFSQKNSRVDGEEIRGYYAKIRLKNTDTTPVELFAVSTNAVKSYV